MLLFHRSRVYVLLVDTIIHVTCIHYYISHNNSIIVHCMYMCHVGFRLIYYKSTNYVNV